MVVDEALDEFFSHKDQKPGWLRDAIAADPGIRALVELVHRLANREPGYTVDQAIAALRKWEQGYA